MAVILAVLAAVLVVPALVPAASAEPIRLDVSPERAVAPATVLLDGACEGESDGDGGMSYPDASVALLDSGLAEQPVPLAEDGTFTAFAFQVPGELPPREYTFRLACTFSERPPTVESDTFSVLPAPTLELDRAEGEAGSSVSVSGTCPRETVVETAAGPEVRFDGEPLGTATLDGVTGEFGPHPLSVPAGAEVGPHEVTTSCGGQGTFSVVAGPAPATTPPTTPPTTPMPQSPTPTPTPGRPSPTPSPTLVAVPDLSGRTLEQARAALDEVGLALEEPDRPDGTVTAQQPGPGELVPVGQVVSVVLAAAPGTAGEARPAFPLSAVLVAVAALLAVGAAALANAERARRRRARERRWVSEAVGTTVESRGTRFGDSPDGTGPSIDFRVEVRSGAGPPDTQEVVARAPR